MGKQAALRAIENAGISPEDIALVISTTATADFHTPSMASIIQHETGAVNAGAFDLNAACTGFVYALDTARRFVETDRSMKYIFQGSSTLLTEVRASSSETVLLLQS